jgi:Cas6b C-terminal domain/Cas6b N-terminal domain
MKIEKSELLISTERALEYEHARAIRGFFGRLFNTVPAFHGHTGTAFIYKHPLIQYKVRNGSALIMGLKEGAYLLKAVPPLEHLTVHGEQLPVVTQTRTDGAVEFGLCGRPLQYKFVTSWGALNQDNYHTYCTLNDDSTAVNQLLTRILIGNLLSLSKAVGYVVDETIQVDLTVNGCEELEAKRGVHLVGFNGRFRANFAIPDNWGVGKFSSRGYGTVSRVDNA